MDSNGNMYANKAALEVMDEQLREHFTPAEEMPADTLAISSPKVAAALSKLNRRARRVYFAEVKRGASEDEALGAAEGSYDR